MVTLLKRLGQIIKQGVKQMMKINLLGKPNDPDLQHRVLNKALDLLKYENGLLQRVSACVMVMVQ